MSIRHKTCYLKFLLKLKLSVDLAGNLKNTFQIWQVGKYSVAVCPTDNSVK